MNTENDEITFNFLFSALYDWEQKYSNAKISLDTTHLYNWGIMGIGAWFFDLEEKYKQGKLTVTELKKLSTLKSWNKPLPVTSEKSENTDEPTESEFEAKQEDQLKESVEETKTTTETPSETTSEVDFDHYIKLCQEYEQLQQHPVEFDTIFKGVNIGTWLKNTIEIFKQGNMNETQEHKLHETISWWVHVKFSM